MTRLSTHRPQGTGSPNAGRFSAATHGSVDLAVLPLPRVWGLWAVLYALVVLGIGLSAMAIPGFSGTELGVDQELSRHHNAVLTVLAMALNMCFPPWVACP